MSRSSRRGTVPRVLERLTDRVSRSGGIVLCIHRTLCVYHCARHVIVLAGVLYFST